ncbi:hypothetical protein ABIG04_009735, partial [Bradyrhizobium japonicum]
MTEAKIWSADLVHLKGLGFLLCRSMKVRMSASSCKSGTPFDVRYASDSGAKADVSGLPRWADIVAKVENRATRK